MIKIIIIKNLGFAEQTLNIDEAQNQSKAAWFRYAPPTGNLMYSMPIVGTNANLYFPSERSQDPMVIGCVRYNKDGIVMEKGSDRASNPKFTDDKPTNGASEVKAALEAAAQFNTHALATANEGAEGKICDFSNLANSQESKSNSSESGEKISIRVCDGFSFSTYNLLCGRKRKQYKWYRQYIKFLHGILNKEIGYEIK